jgi:hypothetical protein
MYHQLWGYEEKLYLGVREQKRFNTTEIDYHKFINKFIFFS